VVSVSELKRTVIRNPNILSEEILSDIHCGLGNRIRIPNRVGGLIIETNLGSRYPIFCIFVCGQVAKKSKVTFSHLLSQLETFCIGF
jgi:hypothetical protein